MTIRLPYPRSVNHYWRSSRGRVFIGRAGRVKRDLDNLCKSTLDALQHAGIYADYSQINELYLRRLPPQPGGAVGVTITAISRKD